MNMNFYVVRINSIQGELTIVSAKTKTLVDNFLACRDWYEHQIYTQLLTLACLALSTVSLPILPVRQFIGTSKIRKIPARPTSPAPLLATCMHFTRHQWENIGARRNCTPHHADDPRQLVWNSSAFYPLWVTMAASMSLLTWRVCQWIGFGKDIKVHVCDSVCLQPAFLPTSRFWSIRSVHVQRHHSHRTLPSVVDSAVTLRPATQKQMYVSDISKDILQAQWSSEATHHLQDMWLSTPCIRWAFCTLSHHLRDRTYWLVMLSH